MLNNSIIYLRLSSYFQAKPIWLYTVKIFFTQLTRRVILLLFSSAPGCSCIFQVDMTLPCPITEKLSNFFFCKHVHARNPIYDLPYTISISKQTNSWFSSSRKNALSRLCFVIHIFLHNECILLYCFVIL